MKLKSVFCQSFGIWNIIIIKKWNKNIIIQIINRNISLSKQENQVLNNDANRLLYKLIGFQNTV